MAEKRVQLTLTSGVEVRGRGKIRGTSENSGRITNLKRKILGFPGTRVVKKS